MADQKNNSITDLIDFAKTFFTKHTLLNILTKYCVFTISEDDWISEYRLAKVIPKGNENIIYPINVDNECKYTTEILNEVEYKEK